MTWEVVLVLLIVGSILIIGKMWSCYKNKIIQAIITFQCHPFKIFNYWQHKYSRYNWVRAQTFGWFDAISIEIQLVCLELCALLVAVIKALELIIRTGILVNSCKIVGRFICYQMIEWIGIAEDITFIGSLIFIFVISFKKS